MTLPVPDLTAAIVDSQRKIIDPWYSWFQQFSQKAPSVDTITKPSPFTANANGTVIITGATTVSLIRGRITISLTGQRIIPISIGDTVSWTGPATVQFLGA